MVAPLLPVLESTASPAKPTGGSGRAAISGDGRFAALLGRAADVETEPHVTESPAAVPEQPATDAGPVRIFHAINVLPGRLAGAVPEETADTPEGPQSGDAIAAQKAGGLETDVAAELVAGSTPNSQRHPAVATEAAEDAGQGGAARRAIVLPAGDPPRETAALHSAVAHGAARDQAAGDGALQLPKADAAPHGPSEARVEPGSAGPVRAAPLRPDGQGGAASLAPGSRADRQDAPRPELAPPPNVGRHGPKDGEQPAAGLAPDAAPKATERQRRDPEPVAPSRNAASDARSDSARSDSGRGPAPVTPGPAAVGRADALATLRPNAAGPDAALALGDAAGETEMEGETGPVRAASGRNAGASSPTHTPPPVTPTAQPASVPGQSPVAGQPGAAVQPDVQARAGGDEPAAGNPAPGGSPQTPGPTLPAGAAVAATPSQSAPVARRRGDNETQVTPPGRDAPPRQGQRVGGVQFAGVETSRPAEGADPLLGHPDDRVLMADRGAQPEPVFGEVRAGDAPTRSEAATVRGAELPRPTTQQLVEALRTGTGTVDLMLEPQELGRLTLSLSTQDGTMTVTVSAERPETLDLIRRNVDLLLQEARQEGFTDVEFAFAGGQGQPGGEPPETASADGDPLAVAAAESAPTRRPSHPAEPRIAGAGLDIRL